MSRPAPAGEQSPDAVWAEMRLHMEWSARLSLIFLFSDSPRAFGQVRQRAADAWQWRTAPLCELRPPEAESAAAWVLAGLRSHQAALQQVRAPAWVELLGINTDREPWDQARRALLARLNEGREWLSQVFARPLVICLPDRWLHEVGHVAPDLWHVRSYVARLARGEEGPAHPAQPAAAHPSEQGGSQTSIAELRKRVDEAAARRSLHPTDAAATRALWDARDRLAMALLLARQRRQALGDSPLVLDDLALALERMASLTTQPHQDRVAAIHEALALRRRLVAALPSSDGHARRLAVAEQIESQLTRDLAALEDPRP